MALWLSTEEFIYINEQEKKNWKSENIPDDETIVPIELDLISGTSFGSLMAMGGISVVV